MPNIKITEADGLPSETLAEGAGTTNNPKVPGFTAHSHKSSGYAHLHQVNISAPSTISWIYIDLSDTTNWPHTDTSVAHLDFLDVAIDAGVNSAWTINLWLVNDVTATNSTRRMLWSRSGTKSTGNNLNIIRYFNPYGPVCKPDSIITSMTETGYTGYNSATNLRTVYSPGTPVVPPADGDVILELVLTGDSINLELDCGYHTHDPQHPA